MDLNQIKKKLEKLERYKPASIGIIISALRNINNAVFDSTDDTLEIENFEDIEPIYNFIISQKLNNQKTYAYALNVFMTLFGPQDLKTMYRRIYTNIAKRVDSERTFQKPNKSEKKMFRSWDEIIKMRSDLLKEFRKTKAPRDFYNYYILSLFTYIPPLRPQELCSCIVVNNVPNYKCNYYLRNSQELHINIYKTEKSLGERLIKVPKVLHNIIVKFGNKFLLPICDGSKKNTSQGVSNYFKGLTGMTPSLLRKVFISNLMDNSPTPDERKKIAYIMGHSVATQVLIYTKFSRAIHGKK